MLIRVSFKNAQIRQWLYLSLKCGHLRLQGQLFPVKLRPQPRQLGLVGFHLSHLLSGDLQLCPQASSLLLQLGVALMEALKLHLRHSAELHGLAGTLPLLVGGEGRGGEGRGGEGRGGEGRGGEGRGGEGGGEGRGRGGRVGF